MHPDWLSKIDSTWTLFLDRDGVLNERRVDDYVKHWGEWHWLPGVLEAIAAISNTFGRVIVITNQRGISRGLMTEADLADIHAHMLADVQAAGGCIDGVYHCPHGKDAHCDCRKPRPGMFFQAQGQFPEIDPAKSIMLGDSSSDMGWALNAGVHGVAVGEGAEGGELRVKDLAEFVEILLSHQAKAAKVSLDAAFWKSRWENADTPWDIGHASPAIVQYLERLTDKGIRILVPGAGNAYEAEWLWRNGFHHVDVVDFSPVALAHLKGRMPDFPDLQLLERDFFSLEGQYDLVVEQTFFCAIDVGLRSAYARKMHELLKPGAVLAGLMFDFPLTEEGPPFGGSVAEYRGHFEPWFEIKVMERCENSIKPRSGREIWVEMVRKPESGNC